MARKTNYPLKSGPDRDPERNGEAETHGNLSVDEAGNVSTDLTPRQLSKAEFGRRLPGLINDRGWRQSDLARAAHIGRDAVSTYVRGRSYPEPENLRKICQALGIEQQELLPNAAIGAVGNDPTPALEIRQSAGHPDKVWLQVNQLVTAKQAFAIMQVLHGDLDAVERYK